MLWKRFHRNLRRLRKHNKLTLQYVADQSGYSQSYISEVERGNKTNPTLEFVDTMASVLNCSPMELLK